MLLATLVHGLAVAMAAAALQDTLPSGASWSTSAAAPVGSSPAACLPGAEVERPDCDVTISGATTCTELLNRTILFERRKSSWNGLYYGAVATFLEQRFANISPLLVEIGTCYGGLPDHLLRKVPNLRVAAVDPLSPGFQQHDPLSELFARWASRYRLSARDFSALWGGGLLAHARRQGYACRYNLFRTNSTIAARSFAARSVHALFVDGLHTYGGVMADLAAFEQTLTSDAERGWDPNPRSLLAHTLAHTSLPGLDDRPLTVR